MIHEGIAFRAGDDGKSVNTLALWCTLSGFPRRSFRRPEDVPANWLPYGNVDWIEGCLGRRLTPDYYPAFLRTCIHRRLWLADAWPLSRVFVKPADRYKRFTGFVTTGTWKGRKKGPLWCSEPVVFLNEWRYYVANGRVLAAHWYFGDEEKTPDAPTLDISWPEGFCGAVDFGERQDGRIELIESQHAAACGWYGGLAEGETFARWLDEGWASLRATS